MKRILVFIILSGLVGFTIFLYFRKEDKNPFIKDTSLYQAIPVSVPVFFEFSSLKDIPHHNPVFKNLGDFDVFSSFSGWIQRIDTTIQINKSIHESLRNQRFLVALEFPGGKKPVPLIILKSESKSRNVDLITLVHSLFPEPEFVYSEQSYTESKIFAVTDSKNREVLYFSFINGLCIASQNLIVVQQSVLQLSESGIIENPAFNKITKLIGSEPEIGVFINQKLFPDIFSEYINPTSITWKNEFGDETKLNHFHNLQLFKGFAAWSELEAEFNDASISLQGNTIITDSLNQFLEVFKNQNPVQSDAEDILPANTLYYTSFSISDKSKFFTDLDNYFQMAGSFYKREDRLRKISLGLKKDFKKSFQTLSDNEFIVAITEMEGQAVKENTLFLMELSASKKAGYTIDSMLTNFADQKNKLIDDYKFHWEAGDHRKYTIFEFPYPSFPGIWLGKPFTSVQARFGVIYKGYLVFAGSREMLENYLSNIESKQLLAADHHFKRIKDKMENRSNIQVYFNKDQGFSLFSEIIAPDLAKRMAKQKNLLKKWQAIGWQVKSENGVFKNDLCFVFDDGSAEQQNSGQISKLSENKKDKVEIGILWKLKLGDDVNTKPVFTLNHTNKSLREIIVQDKSDKLYQISGRGKINWSFDVGAPILSEIFQVDYFSNGKLQYLFSTENKLFILDRNGVIVKGFPIDLPGNATAGVSVFDFDNNRSYRFFVPCSDNKIHIYNKTGESAEGWKFEGTKSTVKSPVRYFRINGKDYIVFKDKSHIYILNRKGEPIAKSAAEFAISQNPLMFVSTGEPGFAATDNNGKIYFIKTDGNYTEKNVGEFSDDHFFRIDDLNGDKKPDFIFADNEVLTVISGEGEMLFSKKVSGDIVFSPQVFNFAGKQKKIGVTDSKGNIYIYNYKGELMPGFPLAGTTEFSIGKLSIDTKNLSLLAGDKNGSLICYQLRN